MPHPLPPSETPDPADAAESVAASPADTALPVVVQTGSVSEADEASDEKSGVTDVLETVGGVIVGALDILSLFD